MSMPDPVAQYETKFRWFAAAGAGVWLLFLLPAVQQAWAERASLSGWAGFVCTLAFGALYIAAFARPWSRRVSGEVWRHVDRSALAVVAALFALGVLMVLTLHEPALAAAVFVAVAGITLLPWRYALPFATALALGSEALARTVPGWDGAKGVGLSVALASFAVWGMWTAMRRSRDLVSAREENAQLVIGQERARLARDLHDILGHSLTVIAVKAELADRLVDVSPEQARAEIVDIQRLSRDALADVRRTVDAARTPSLALEITRARAALDAAEIEAELPSSADDVDSRLRELFAWTLREGVTNVVRHSGATRCTVTLGRDRITIADNGRGMRAELGSVTGEGRGLTGLRERASATGAQVLVDAPSRGGFSLSVVGSQAATVPAGRIPAPAEHAR